MYAHFQNIRSNIPFTVSVVFSYEILGFYLHMLSFSSLKKGGGIRAENWWHISTQKPPNVGSSIAISEPIIAGLVSARGRPNPVKLGIQVQQPTQTG